MRFSILTYLLPALLIALLFTAAKADWVFAGVVATPAAVEAATNALEEHLDEPATRGTLVVVDYSLPSQAKRLQVIDLASRKILLNARCAHGKNSGDNFAREFSNSKYSNKSSLGLYRIGESYVGRHGSSLRLDGLDKHLNSNARQRNIVIHSADYVETWSIIDNFDEGLRLGRSLGCFVVTEEKYFELLSHVTRPAYLYAHAN